MNRDDVRVSLLLLGTLAYVLVVMTVLLAATMWLQTALDDFGARMAALAAFAAVWIGGNAVLVATANRLWPSGGASQ